MNPAGRSVFIFVVLGLWSPSWNVQLPVPEVGLLLMPRTVVGPESGCVCLHFSFVKTQVTDACVLSLLFFTAADLFTDLENAFQGKIDAAYFETSKYLLDVLNKKYSLLDHMQAMRRYLLLGQGDFIRHLMDLLK